MSEAAKKYRVQFKNAPPEEWTQAEHDAVQAMTGDRFAEYVITPIQPEKPAEVVQGSKPRNSTNADATAA